MEVSIHSFNLFEEVVFIFSYVCLFSFLSNFAFEVLRPSLETYLLGLESYLGISIQ